MGMTASEFQLKHLAKRNIPIVEVIVETIFQRNNTSWFST